MAKKQFYDLREYITYLEKIGDVKHIKAEVDPILELSEIADRVVKEGGPALIFENVRGASFPLAINLFGTEERVEIALGRKPRDVGEELVDSLDAGLILVEPGKPQELARVIIDLLRDEPKCRRIGQNARRLVKERFSWEGICQKTVEVYENARRRSGDCGK